MTLSGNTVIGNRSNLSGGGIYIDGGVSTLTDNIVIYNFAVSCGGGINIDGNSTAEHTSRSSPILLKLATLKLLGLVKTG